MILVDLSKCTGCRRCEAMCAFYHTGRINRRMARIKVLNLYETGVDGPVLCIQCKERYCMKCPEGALSLGPAGEVIVSPASCTLCGTCESRCPIGAVERFREIVYVCDLCGGRPRCVDACTESAITLAGEDAARASLADMKKDTREMSPEEKRHRYVMKQGTAVRNTWSRVHD